MNRVLRDGVSALGCLVAAAIIVVVIPAPHAAEPVPVRGQRSIYFTSPAGFTVVVTGNATWAQLRQLAASLRPVGR